jgi:hypothetical protein
MEMYHRWANIMRIFHKNAYELYDIIMEGRKMNEK